MPRETNSKRDKNQSEVSWDTRRLTEQEEKKRLELMKKWAERKELTKDEQEKLTSYNLRSRESTKDYSDKINKENKLFKELENLTEKVTFEWDLSPDERTRFHTLSDFFSKKEKRKQQAIESLPWYISQQRVDETERLFQQDLRELKGAKNWERMRNKNADFKSILDKDGNVIKTYFESLNNQVEGVDHWILNQMTVSFEGTATDDYVLSRMFMVDDT